MDRKERIEETWRSFGRKKIVGIEIIDTIVKISDVQPRVSAARSIFDNGGSRGNSTILRPIVVSPLKQLGFVRCK